MQDIRFAVRQLLRLPGFAIVAILAFGIGARDSLTLAAIANLLALVAIVACLISARRATRVDPLVALRSE